MANLITSTRLVLIVQMAAALLQVSVQTSLVAISFILMALE